MQKSRTNPKFLRMLVKVIFQIFFFVVVVNVSFLLFIVRLKKFSSYGDVIITVKGLIILPYSAYIWPLDCTCGGSFSVSHRLKSRDLGIYDLIERTCNVHTYCQALSSETVVNCFKDLGQSRPRF